MASDTDCLILAARRTPIGAMLGSLADHPATSLGAAVIERAVEDAGVEPAHVEQCFMGCVLPAGAGQAPARTAALAAGLPVSTPATTVNKVCGSGMQSIILAGHYIALGEAELALAGGMESMSNAPFLLPNARRGYRLGHAELLDHMVLDGLHCAVSDRGMGPLAEDTAAHFGFTRETQDDFARRSLERALRAIEGGDFEAEIVAVRARDGSEISRDDRPSSGRLDKIAKLPPAFGDNGTITAASASGIADGAAAVVLASGGYATRHGLEPLARIVGHASHAREPAWFTTAPVGAIRTLAERIGWELADVDLFEINEAFACVTLAAIKELDLDPERVNVNGGACALGHPIGATGCRIVVTLIHALKRRRKKRGIAALCIGGGEATAIAVELT